MMNKIILTNTIVIVILMTASMTIPLVSAQAPIISASKDAQKLQDILKGTDVQELLAPEDRLINIICPSDSGPNFENCQVFEGTKVAGPTGPGLMAPGDTLVTGICSASFTDLSECRIFTGTPVP